MVASRKTRAAAVSILSNTCLVIGKLTVGMLTGAVSVVAEALHSGIDLVAAVIAYFSVRIADQPPDSEHPYGHGKAEAISGAVEALLIVVAAVWIIYEAVHRLISGGEMEKLGLAAGVMGVSALVNTMVSRYLLKVAREEDSLAIEADGHHLATDVYTSLGVAFGVGLVWWTEWQALDAIVALGVAIWIGYVGLKLTLAANRQLMDARLPEAELQRIRDVLDTEDRIHSWHGLQTRKAGSQRHVIIHIMCCGDMRLKEAHAISYDLEQSIAKEFEPAQVVIHIDAYDPEEPEVKRRQDDAQESHADPIDRTDRKH